MYLCTIDRLSQDLTVHDILNTHEILMGNSISNSSRKLVNAGKFRKISCNAGLYHIYPPPSTIEASIQKVVENYKRDKANNIHPVKLTTKLFFDFLAIHPFEDGNGRTARLLAAYAFMVSGTPFPVLICSGRSRSRRHCLQAIRKKQLNYNNRWLETIIATSIAIQWKSYHSFTQAGGTSVSSEICISSSRTKAR